MINQESINLVISTIAIIIVPPVQPRSIDQKVLQQVLTRPLTIGQSPEGLMVSSQRDQIEAIVGGNKINVRDLSGNTVFSESKIPSILHFFLGPSQVTSYGVNLIITVPRVEPLQWLRDNILSPQISERTKKTLMGGAGALKIAADKKTWNIKLEPGEDDIISIDFNASEETQKLPDVSGLCQELQEQFDALLRFLNDLGL